MFPLPDLTLEEAKHLAFNPGIEIEVSASARLLWNAACDQYLASLPDDATRIIEQAKILMHSPIAMHRAVGFGSARLIIQKVKESQ